MKIRHLEWDSFEYGNDGYAYAGRGLNRRPVAHVFLRYVDGIDEASIYFMDDPVVNITYDSWDEIVSYVESKFENFIQSCIE